MLFGRSKREKTDKYIVDVGMHDGKDSEYYARRGYSVVAFEANPQICRVAQGAFQEIRNVK